jgi:thiamine-monophosphate kinase
MLQSAARGNSRPDAERDPALATRIEAQSEPIRRYLYPEPRVRTGVLLGRSRAATACMDLSDGLADAVTQVAEASGVGAIIEAAALPVDAETRAWFVSTGVDEVTAAVRGGDDYELLITARPKSRRRLLAARAGGAPLTRIGVCTPERDVRLRRDVGGTAYETPLPAGFSHFR